ncbi:MAG: type II RES/Xre toxin-antitoxin system antitoxin [Shimia sp.]
MASTTAETTSGGVSGGTSGGLSGNPVDIDTLVNTPRDLRWQDIAAGIPVEFVSNLIGQGILSREQVEIAIPYRTLARRRKAKEALKLEEADTLVRLLRIRAHALAVFEDEAVARDWLTLPNPALGDASPMEIAETDIGAREVEGVLGRIEHGVFA